MPIWNYTINPKIVQPSFVLVGQVSIGQVGIGPIDLGQIVLIPLIIYWYAEFISKQISFFFCFRAFIDTFKIVRSFEFVRIISRALDLVDMDNLVIKINNFFVCFLWCFNFCSCICLKFLWCFNCCSCMRLNFLYSIFSEFSMITFFVHLIFVFSKQSKVAFDTSGCSWFTCSLFGSKIFNEVS